MHFETLKILSDGNFHSGGDIGNYLGISRASVWKHIQKLGDIGIEVHSVKGKGYRIAGGLELLAKDRVLEAVKEIYTPLLAQSSLIDLHYTVNSTNDIAMGLAKKGVASGYSCIAEQQISGRGRRGRQWVSPFASNLYMSTVWHFEQGVAALEGLSLATGVAVARALQRIGVSNVHLKWPNDILVLEKLGEDFSLSGRHKEYKKLAGILLEIAGNAADQCQVVIGVGVNLKMPENAAKNIDQPWADVSSLLDKRFSRNKVTGYVLGEMLKMLTQFQHEGFKPFWKEWSSLDVYQDQPVELKMADKNISGIARGVSEKGALILETGQGLEHFNGGEISLRAMP